MVASFKRKRWREAQRLRLDLNGVMRDLIGDAGIEPADLHAILPRILEIQRTAGGARRAFVRRGSLAGSPELRSMISLADEVRGRIDDFVVLGSGSAAEAAHVLVSALTRTHAPGPLPGGVRVHVPDAIDPSTLAALLGQLDLRRTLFDVVSASGETGETLAAFLIVRDRLLKELGAVEYKQQIVVTTAAGHGALRQIVHDEGFHDVGIDGETTAAPAASILSLAALFPAACAGIDVEELLAGAAFMDARGAEAAPEENPVLLLAVALHLSLVRFRVRAAVLRPYAGGFHPLAEWFARAWNEATASPRTASASGIPAGTAPPAEVEAPNPPADRTPPHLAVFVRIEEHAGELVIPRSYDDLEAASYLGGLGLGALVNLAEEAAEVAWARSGFPSIAIRMPRLNAFALGELVILLGTAIALVRALTHGEDGAGVAADETSPADVRALTHGLAGRPGYESKRAEAQRWLARKEIRHVI